LKGPAELVPSAGVTPKPSAAPPPTRQPQSGSANKLASHARVCKNSPVQQPPGSTEILKPLKGVENPAIVLRWNCQLCTDRNLSEAEGEAAEKPNA